MNFSDVPCLNHECREKGIITEGAGANIGPRLTISKHRCPNCGITVMIIPMSEKYEYFISASDDYDRREKRIKEAEEKAQKQIEKTKLDLAEEVLRINKLFNL